jgi:predicted HTH transcriptional regulator
MRATRSELIEKIRLDEDGLLDLKEERFAGAKLRGPAREDLADELAAFANSAGGVLVLGVDDRNLKVLGIPLDRLDVVETLIREVCDPRSNRPWRP